MIQVKKKKRSKCSTDACRGTFRKGVTGHRYLYRMVTKDKDLVYMVILRKNVPVSLTAKITINFVIEIREINTLRGLRHVWARDLTQVQW